MKFTAQKLSGSTDGRPIKVVATTTPGTTVHTAIAGTSDDTFDEIYLWATNTDTVDRVLTLEWGGTTNPDDRIVKNIPAGDTLLVAAGWRLQNSVVVKAFGAAANIINIVGHVNRIQAT